MKHLKYLKYKLATCAFSAMSHCCSDKWRLVVVELDADVEADGGVWSSSVPQRSGNHCATLSKHLLGGLGEHMRETTTAHLASTCYRALE